MKPTQPLTTGPWGDFNRPLSRRMMELSDIVSFHSYDAPAAFEAKLKICEAHERPLLCTEWLLRQMRNDFQTLRPQFRDRKIGCWNWGLVAGRTQTYFPWGSPKDAPEPKQWQHDILRGDGTPFDAAEVAAIKRVTQSPPPTATESNYRGWESLALRNDLIELHIVPQIGGRVIQFKLGGKEFLWVNPQLAGQLPPPDGLAPDGDADLVMCENEIKAGRIGWLENLDDRRAGWKPHGLPRGDTAARGAYHSLVVADFDNDDDPDVFSCEIKGIRGDKPPRWFIWENRDGKGSQFVEHVILDANLGGHLVVAGDVDQDGDPDLIGKLWRARKDNANEGRNHVDLLENRVAAPSLQRLRVSDRWVTCGV